MRERKLPQTAAQLKQAGDIYLSQLGRYDRTIEYFKGKRISNKLSGVCLTAIMKRMKMMKVQQRKESTSTQKNKIDFSQSVIKF